ncbi:hypothetical protein A11A3_15774 [Alcanivorax hongdengensis A-11-3]|uniref:Uncharacterized protein n=1 Tax=Alcanivorax hongdengensis A-11-3 TaxID=1177179 RepID=L0W7U1_9GAMM|nr:hypothetical protein [Alcanivorax hongdengensis]EKF73024.1 hypothetical protein A11A3_15774 [Alcanivorax hongdengensis A-11-3]
MNRAPGQSGGFRYLVVAALLCGMFVLQPAMAAAPAMTTLGALAREEGWNPDAGNPPNMDKSIPRDFPVPISAHDLSASNGVGAAGVKGVNAEQAEAFYNQVFKMQNWRVDTHMSLPGCDSFVACREDGVCVNLTAVSEGGMCSDPGEMNMLFFQDDK